MRATKIVLAGALACTICVRPVLAGAALVFDAENGHVLYAEDVDLPWFPASLTKLMTAYLAFDAVRDKRATMETKVFVSPNANKQPPTRLGLRAGKDITLGDALRALIIKSANDIAVAIGETLGGDEEAFVKEMNATAKRLGMSRTHFTNPHGLPSEQQVTTARDMALLAQAIVDEFPEHMPLFAEVEARIGKIRLRTHNAVIVSYPGGDGMKTGFTCWSGYNVVASAKRDGHRLVAVVLGESSGGVRTIRASALLNHGFKMLEWKTLFVTPRINNLPVESTEVGVGPNAAKAERMRVCEYRARKVTKKRRAKRSRKRRPRKK